MAVSLGFNQVFYGSFETLDAKTEFGLVRVHVEVVVEVEDVRLRVVRCARREVVVAAVVVVLLCGFGCLGGRGIIKVCPRFGCVN